MAPRGLRAHLPLPILNQGPHEDDVSQGGEVPLAGQRGVRLAAWLSFSRETGLVYQEVCDLGEQRERPWNLPACPVHWFSQHRTMSNTSVSIANRQHRIPRNQGTTTRTGPERPEESESFECVAPLKKQGSLVSSFTLFKF